MIKKLEESSDILQKEQASKILIDEEEKEQYDKYLNEKALMYLRVLQSQLIVAVDGEELIEIEDKVKAFKERVDATAWGRYKEVTDANTFGINPNYTFKVGEEVIERRFSFRYMDFIPSVDKKADSRYTVSFDD